MFPLLFLLFLSPCSCLRCYECNSDEEKSCLEPTSNSTLLQECNIPVMNDLTSRGNPICRQIYRRTFTVGIKNDTLVVVRQCAYDEYDFPMDQMTYCNEATVFQDGSRGGGLEFYKDTICDCATDGCNTAVQQNRQRIHTLILIALTTLSIQIVK